MKTVKVQLADNTVFFGQVLAETDTHYFVQHGTDPQRGEWFAKKSNKVNCHAKDDYDTRNA